MTYIAIYEDPFNDDGITEGGTRVSHAIRLQISSNVDLDDEAAKKILRRHLLDKFHIADVKEEKIR